MTEAVRKELEAEVAKLEVAEAEAWAKLLLQKQAVTELSVAWHALKNSKAAIQAVLDNKEAA